MDIHTKGGTWMELRSKSVQMALFIFAVITLICAFPLLATTGEVEITGVIFLPDAPDVADVYPVILAGENGEMYAISIDGKCVELIEHENKFVKLIGTVAIDKNGGKTITVKHYEILKEWPERL